MYRTTLLKQFGLWGICALMVFCVACNDVLQIPEQQQPMAGSVESDKAAVSIAVIGAQARTVFPQVSLSDIKNYRLLGGVDGKAETEIIVFSTEEISIYLEEGIWNFTLNAYNQDNELFLQGKIENQQIFLTEPNHIDFSLFPLNSDVGSIDITLTFPADTGITRITAECDANTNLSINEEISGASFRYAKTGISGGDYFVIFKLFRGTELGAVVSELVLVRSNLISKKTITLEGTSLKQAYYITFNANGGEPAPASQAIMGGGKIVAPDAITKGDYIFGGWFTDADYTNEWNFANNTVIADTTLYAKWTAREEILVEGATFVDKYDWLDSYAESNTTYIIEAAADEAVYARSLSWLGKTDIAIRIRGIDETRTLSLLNNGSMFTVESGTTLILEENITLKGHSNTAPLVYVNTGGTLIMKTGATITGNSIVTTNTLASTINAGGVFVSTGGAFTMNGGAISNNSVSLSYPASSTIIPEASTKAGGVTVQGTGIFTMNDGIITGNTTSSNNTYAASTANFIAVTYGGGVYVDTGTIIMNGGTISGNTATALSASTNSVTSAANARGGGVYVGLGTFIMNGGTITNNTASASRSNTTYASYPNLAGGGGVYVQGPFTMTGGIISDNTASASTTASGGGIYSETVFTMSGGTISGNAASSSASYGGGVYVTGRFNKTGGVIYGYTAGDASSNVVKNGDTILSNRGHAVYASGATPSGREATAGSTVNLVYENGTPGTQFWNW